MTLTAPIHETATTTPLLTAVTYQRVSTKEQASKGGRDEGFSIPAQRQANARKAEDLKARIVAEFVDAGESARSADRPDLPAALRCGEAQLWLVRDNVSVRAAVVTLIQDVPLSDATRERRCLLWLIGGRDASKWGDGLVRTLEPWARARGCVALWGVGRKGWARLVARLGFAPTTSFNGETAWQRRIA